MPHGMAGSCLGCAWPQPHEPFVHPSLCPGWSRFTLAQSFQLLQSPPSQQREDKANTPRSQHEHPPVSEGYIQPEG